MAAITKRLLHLRSNFHSNARPHPYPLHHFSSLSDADADTDPHIAQTDLNSEGQISPPLSSSFSSIKDSLHEQPPSQNRDRIPRTPSPSRASSTDSIHRYLSEFRIRSAAPPPSTTGEYVSLQELYERNLNSKVDNSAKSSSTYSGSVRSFDPIRDSLRQLNPNARNDSGGKLSDRWSSSGIAENLKLKGDANANKYLKTFVGGGDSFMMSFLRGKGDYHQDLGKNLKMLRPQNRKGKWFSLQELSDRLSKLREAQKKERNMISSIRGGIAGTAQQKESKLPLKNLGFLVGGTESYELLPPKKELVEKFFHPDNLSSAEKLKLELKKVRDEFKMSESDCGSARVQVAQLTLKIKHLSNVLQKKDKHSRKGLQAMVQRRKKLLKYLRRTDWDSYCLVLSKLGLRDNPDIKA